MLQSVLFCFCVQFHLGGECYSWVLFFMHCAVHRTVEPEVRVVLA